MEYRTHLLTAAALALMAGGMAQADVKIVATVNTTGMPAPPADRPADAPQPPSFPQTVTAYYKGSHARIEEGNGPVSLYDFTTGKVARLDPARQTYFIAPIDRMPGGPGRHRQGPPMDGKITLTAADGTKTIAGQSARSYTVSGSLSPKGGGFPGGPPPDGGGQGGEKPKDTITGTVWFSDGVALTSDSKYAALPLTRLLVFMAGPVAKPLGDALNSQKLIPLESAITVTHPLPPRRDSDASSDNGASTVTITTTMTVMFVSQSALDDSLFQPPSGYTQIDAPAPRGGPMGPPPGGGGGPDGPPPGG